MALGCGVFNKAVARAVLPKAKYKHVRNQEAYDEAVNPGQHAAIIAPELWQIVQEKLAANRHERSLAAGAEAPSLLSGLIADADGNRMTPTHATTWRAVEAGTVALSLNNPGPAPISG